MAYADFTYYSTVYLGTAIPTDSFAALALRASAVIDLVTFDRAANEVAVGTVNKIKMATCAVAEELQRQDASGGADGIVFESLGQYSVNYGKGSIRAKSNMTKLETAAKMYLANTYLMFGGFNPGEYGGASADYDL